MKEHAEVRWALWNYKDESFCGKYNWRKGVLSDDLTNAHKVPTFRTRELAREAIRRMISSRKVRPVKVTVRITTA